MEYIEERAFGGLTVRIDRTLCVGFGDCVGIAPEVFVLDEEGVVTFRDSPIDVAQEQLLLACDVCPVDALSVFDGEGRQLVP
jgi:ferredoxin